MIHIISSTAPESTLLQFAADVAAELTALGSITITDASLRALRNGRWTLTIQYLAGGTAYGVLAGTASDLDDFLVATPAAQGKFLLGASAQDTRRIYREQALLLYTAAAGVLPRQVLAAAVGGIAPGASGAVAVIGSDGVVSGTQIDVQNRSSNAALAGTVGYAARLGDGSWFFYPVCC
jgi:hypothetical protein